MVLSVCGNRVGVASSHVAFVGAAVNGGITIQHFAPEAFVRNADAVAAPEHGSEIASHHHRGGLIFPKAHVSQHAVVGVVSIDPAPSVGSEVAFIQCGLAAVIGVQIAYPALYPLMRSKPEQMPLDAAVVLPLAILANLAAHE